MQEKLFAFSLSPLTAVHGQSATRHSRVRTQEPLVGRSRILGNVHFDGGAGELMCHVA